MISFVPGGYPRRSARVCAEIVLGEKDRKEPTINKANVNLSPFSNRLRYDIRPLLYCGTRELSRSLLITGSITLISSLKDQISDLRRELREFKRQFWQKDAAQPETNTGRRTEGLGISFLRRLSNLYAFTSTLDNPSHDVDSRYVRNRQIVRAYESNDAMVCTCRKCDAPDSTEFHNSQVQE